MPEQPPDKKIIYFGDPSNPTPKKLAKFTKASRYVCVGMITMISATDIFDGGQAKLINFSLGVLVLLLGGIDIAIGVEPDKPEPEQKNSNED